MTRDNICKAIIKIYMRNSIVKTRNPYPRVFAALTLCAALFCGLTAFAAEEPRPETASEAALTALPPETETEAEGALTEPPTDAPALKTETPPELTPEPATPPELYPSGVETSDISDDERQIVKTYRLTEGQRPSDIPREPFERDGYYYVLLDITETAEVFTETREQTETVTIDTESNDINAIAALLSPTAEYASPDGYAGTLTLDLSTIACAAAGTKSTGFTVEETREYPGLTHGDTSQIPKSVTNSSGRTLEIGDVTWVAQQSSAVDYQEIPDTYRAVVKYTGKGYKNVVTGYVTTAEYRGEVSKEITGGVVYKAYFFGREIEDDPNVIRRFDPEHPDADEDGYVRTAKDAPKPEREPVSPVPILAALAALALMFAVFGAFFFFRHNTKIYVIRNDRRVLCAKDKLGGRNLTTDLSTLGKEDDAGVFHIEIDKFSAKLLNGRTIEIVYGSAVLKHQVAYEGGVYVIEADFRTVTAKAIY